MEDHLSSTTLIDISRYCSSFADGDFWSSSQSSSSRSPVQQLFSPTRTGSSNADSPILPTLPQPPTHWSLTSTFANIDLDPPLPSLWSSTAISSDQHQPCNCCRCLNSNESWTDKFPSNRTRCRPRTTKPTSSSSSSSSATNLPTPIQRPSPSRRSMNLSSKLSIFDKYDDQKATKTIHFDDEEQSDEKNIDDDGTLRLHVSNIPFTWSKEKLAEVFGKYGTTFDVEVVYNERGSKGFGFVTFLAKRDALEAKQRMDREIVDGRRLVVNFAKPKQKSSSSKDHQPISLTSFKTNSATWKSSNNNERSSRSIPGNHHQPLAFSTPPTARRQHLSGFASLSSTPTRSTNNNSSHRYYL